VLIGTTALGSDNAIAPTSFGDIGTALAIPSPIESLSVNSSIDEIKQAIVYEAKNNGINPMLMIDLSDCENDFGNKCIVDTNQKLSCGQFMFQEETFEGYCPDLKWEVKDMVFQHPADNIKCAVRMASDTEIIKRHWKNCSVKLKI
jgi:hypothetical protein